MKKWIKNLKKGSLKKLKSSNIFLKKATKKDRKEAKSRKTSFSDLIAREQNIDFWASFFKQGYFGEQAK